MEWGDGEFFSSSCLLGCNILAVSLLLSRRSTGLGQLLRSLLAAFLGFAWLRLCS